MGYEIEKKWIPEKWLMEKIKAYAGPVIIEQAYLCREPVIRIRKEADNYYMTYKGSGLLKREEYNLPLNQTAYNELLPKCSGKTIRKNRYTVKISDLYPDSEQEFKDRYGGLKIEMDIFEGTNEGLVILEVEFPAEEDAAEFEEPEGFGTNVTGLKEYTNSFLSE